MLMFDSVRNLFRRKTYQVPSSGSGGWYPLIREANSGFWQRNIELSPAVISTFYADFACKTLIARDIAKLPVRLMQRDAAGIGIWTETTNPAYSPVLRKPNHYQTRNQFWESWVLSKLSRGNTFVLKARDNRRVVTALYVLDPRRVTPMIADDGSVFYSLRTDALNVTGDEIMVPATEIIHDRMNCDHWLVGVPPIYASGLAAMQGLNIQNQSAKLFANNAQPGGVLTAPGRIEDDTVARLKADWESKFGGNNFGKLAVLGDGLKFEKMALTAVEGQLIEQLKMTAEMVCSTYHVPAFMIGAGPEPATGSAQERTLRYYQQCLQSLIEDAESVLDEGLGLGDVPNLGVEFDIDNLLRMDTATQADAVTKLVGGSILTPNEGRLRFNAKPLTGGDTVYMQQQNYSLEALAKRDKQPDPFGTAKPPAPAAPPPEPVKPPDDNAAAKHLAHELRKSLRLPAAA